MAVTPAIVFGVGSRGDRPGSARESGVSGVQWDIAGLLNGGKTPGGPLKSPVETTSS